MARADESDALAGTLEGTTQPLHSIQIHNHILIRSTGINRQQRKRKEGKDTDMGCNKASFLASSPPSPERVFWVGVTDDPLGESVDLVVSSGQISLPH